MYWWGLLNVASYQIMSLQQCGIEVPKQLLEAENEYKIRYEEVANITEELVGMTLITNESNGSFIFQEIVGAFTGEA